MVIFLVESELVSLWKGCFHLHIYTTVLIIPVGVTVFFACCCFCKIFALLTMLFAWRGWAFPNGLVSTCTVFKNSTWQQLFRMFVSLSIVSDICSRISFPKRSLFSFWSNSYLFFNMDLACRVLFIIPFKALRRLWYDRAMFVCSTNIILWVTNFIRSLIETDESCYLFAVSKLSHSWHSGPITSILFLLIFS